VFWDSVLGGFGLLLSVRIWVGLVLYIVANLFTLGIGGALFSKDKTVAAGCLFTALVRPALGAVFISLFVVSLFPVMLGAKEAVGFQMIRTMLWPICAAGLIAFIIVMLLGFVPILGSLISESVTLPTFIQGVIVFRFFMAAVMASLPENEQPSNTNIYPGFWETIGYLLIAAVFARLAIFLSALIMAKSAQTGWEDKAENLGVIIGLVFGVVGGFLPLFMYVQHVHHALVTSA
jgi:hypothetical protein